MKKLALTALWITLTAFLTLSGPLQAAPRYNYYDLGTLGGNNSDAMAINRNGTVVGFAQDEVPFEWAFLKDPDQAMQNLGTFPDGGLGVGGTVSRAFGVNNSGLVVGWANDANGVYVAFRKNPGFPLKPLGALGGAASKAWGINEAGQVVGEAADANGILWAFQRDIGQPMVNLGALGGEGSRAYAINNNGQVVGYAYTGEGYYRAFLKNPGQDMEDLGALGGTWSTAYAINDGGQIVGEANDADGHSWAFLKNPGQDMENLGGLGGTFSAAKGINNHGWVVGQANDADLILRAFLWENGVMHNLNDVTVGRPAGVSLVQANAINDRGWIVGRAAVDVGDHAFLLKPMISIEPWLMLLLDDVRPHPWPPQIDGQGPP